MREIELSAQLRHDGAWQHGHAILESLAVTDEDLSAREINILDAQPHAFHHTHAGAVQKPTNQSVRAVKPAEHLRHLIWSENDGQTMGGPGALDPPEPRQLDVEHLLVKEQ